jgi:DNA-directed RNA polymerase specialized sigma subunit
MNMTAVDNEKLCALAQTGNMDALNSLVENNMRFIRMTAHEIWSAQIEVNRALGVTFDDLVQEGCLGRMRGEIQSRWRQQIFDIRSSGNPQFDDRLHPKSEYIL